MFIPFMILVWMILVHPSTFYFIEKPHLEHRFGIRIAKYIGAGSQLTWNYGEQYRHGLFFVFFL